MGGRRALLGMTKGSGDGGAVEWAGWMQGASARGGPDCQAGGVTVEGRLVPLLNDE